MSILNTQQREKLSYQYTVALEQGDMDTLARILSYAERDPMLEDMILEVNQALLSETTRSTDTTTKEESTMPVFNTTKRKRGSSRTRWTAIAAVFAALLFSVVAVFFNTEHAPDYNAEDVAATAPTVDKEAITRQFLNALNDNIPSILPDYLTDDFQYDERGIDQMGQIDMAKRIARLHQHFTEIHFFISDTHGLGNHLSATLTLKGLHRNAAGQELNYVTTGFIDVNFTGNQISEAEFTINIDDFIDRYPPQDVSHLPQTTDLYRLPPDDFDKSPVTQQIDVEDGARGMSLNIDAGHAELLIGSLPNIVLQGDIQNLGTFDYSEKGKRIKIINIDNHPYYLIDDDGNAPQWAFKIGETMRTDLDVNIGNRDAMLDLSQIDLQGLSITMGNSTTTLSLPVTGENYHVTVNIISSLGKLRLDYPRKLGMRIDAYDGVWQSENYNHAEQIINLQLNGSLSALEMFGF